MKRKSKVTEMVPFRAMTVDRSYQRELSSGKVKKIEDAFDEKGLGALHLSLREEKYPIIDGQHRWAAAMNKGLGDMKVHCIVYRGLTRAEEAELFLILNDSKTMSAIDRYKAAVVAEDETALAIEKVLAHYGLRIAGSGAEGTVRCISKVEQVYKAGPAALERLFLILTEAWGTRPSAFEQVVVDGVGKVVTRYNGELDEASLVKKLATYRGGPAALAGDARGYADFRPIGVGRACAELIVDTYNKGKRSGALPPL